MSRLKRQLAKRWQRSVRSSEASNAGDVARTRTLLEDMGATWHAINAIFDRMPERCDPYVYFERVRPYIHGWRDNPALPERDHL